MSNKMLVYEVEDWLGTKSRHLAINKESAIQAHLVHYGLSYLKEPSDVSNGKPLSEFKDRSLICWNKYCCLAGASNYITPNLKEITYAEFIVLRYKQWEKQNKICPILKQEIKYGDACLDHCHKTKAEKLGENGKGLLRGVLHFQANSWEGKVTNAFKRYGLHKFDISLPEALRNLANYIENPPMKPEYIHPDERVFEKIGKRDFNKICRLYLKIYPKRKVLPKYPKRGKMTKELKELFNKVKDL